MAYSDFKLIEVIDSFGLVIHECYPRIIWTIRKCAGARM